MIKAILSIFVFYFLALIQTSFMPHLAIYGVVFNLVLFIVILWNIFENSDNYFGLYQAIIGGFFLDIFSSHFIGYNIIILLLIAILLKFFFKRYVRVPFSKD